MSNTGNINYSLNKNNFYKIVSGSLIGFLPFYYIVTVISIIYIFTIRFGKGKDVNHYLKSITYNSPFKILELSEIDQNDSKYTGLTERSYITIITTYVIALILILEGLVRNLIYSNYVNIIQINPNNNPYNNNNCISKIKENAQSSVSKNYSAITSLAINFLFPFFIPYLVHILKFDNYDIKHSKWFNYLILFLVFYPFLIMVLSRASLHKKLEIFPNLEKFLDTSDINFISKIKEEFNFKMGSILVFLLIIFIFSFYTIVYSDIKYSLKKKIMIYVFLIIIIFIFIPLFMLFFGLASVLNNKNINDNSEDEIIKNITNNGISGLYDLLVKYNYPCFIK